MNYGQLKSELVSLGFADEAEIAEFGNIVPEALNRAITEINLTICPNIGTYMIEQDGTDGGIVYYDIAELTKDIDGTQRFLEYADVPVMINDGKYIKFSDYEIENDMLVFDGDMAGTFKVFYKKAHTPFTVDTANDTEIELPLKSHILVPLLTAYYVWLEDEKSKAVDYYNQYEKLTQSIFTSKKPRMTIMSGGI